MSLERSRGIPRRLVSTSLVLIACALLFVSLAFLKNRSEKFSEAADAHAKERQRFLDLHSTHKGAAATCEATARAHRRWAVEAEARSDHREALINREEAVKLRASAARRFAEAEECRALADHHSARESKYRDAARRPWTSLPADLSYPSGSPRR